MTDNEKEILREFKELGGRANAEILSKRMPFSIRYIQYLLRNLHEARYLKVDTLARYPMYQLPKRIRRRWNYDSK
ncbi:hypothetical protein KAV79_02395 [Candidatus Aerophobetes bacterium]|nr:hypothetical protein [Candidatus Aerophobetes bacterium]